MDTTRTFVAVSIVEPTKSILGKLIKTLEPEFQHVRWTEPSQFHITVKFIGDIENTLVPETCSRIRSCCSDLPPFQLKVSGLGTFPAGKPPRVIWAGVSDEDGVLSQLHESLDHNLRDLGILHETRKFTPHITLGRVSKGTTAEHAAEVFAKFGSDFESRFEVERIVLMSSEREKRGFVYEPMDSVNL